VGRARQNASWRHCSPGRIWDKRLQLQISPLLLPNPTFTQSVHMYCASLWPQAILATSRFHLIRSHLYHPTFAVGWWLSWRSRDRRHESCVGLAGSESDQESSLFRVDGPVWNDEIEPGGQGAPPVPRSGENYVAGVLWVSKAPKCMSGLQSSRDGNMAPSKTVSISPK